MMFLKSILVAVPLLLGSVSGSGRQPVAEALSFSIAPMTTAQQEAVEVRYRAGEDTSQYHGEFELAFYRGPKDWYEVKGLSAVHALLPGARVYRGRAHSPWPGWPFTMVEQDSAFYSVPRGQGFNTLLHAAGIQITDSSLVACAKAFVLLVLLDKVRPESLTVDREDTLAVVLDALRKRQKVAGDWYDLQMDIKVGGAAETWYFEIFRGGFRFVLKRGSNGKLRDYTLLGAAPRHPMDSREALAVDALSPSCAQGLWGHASAAVTSPRL
jgi:hypothetical protein